MNLGKWFANRIKNTAGTRQPKGRYPFQIEAEKQSFALTITLEAVEQLSCKMTELSIRHLKKQSADAQQFNAILKALSHKLTYLQESIVLIERDDQNMQAMLRSVNPQSENETIAYFEMMVKPAVEANLKRIVRRGQEKSTTAFVVGFDLLERLINDVCTIITEALAPEPKGQNLRQRR